MKSSKQPVINNLPLLLGLLHQPFVAPPRFCAAGKRFVVAPRSSAKSTAQKWQIIYDRLLRLLSLCLLAASCTQEKKFEIPELDDPPKIFEAKQVSMTTQVPAYGIAIFSSNAKIFEVNIEAGDSSKIRLGEPALISVGGEPDVTHAEVTKFLRNASGETGQSIAWLQSNNGSKIPSGEFVFAKIQVGKRANVIAVPQKSIFIRDSKTWVITPTKEKTKFAPTEVELGEQFGDQVEIKSGIHIGDQILTDAGLGYLFPDFKSQAEGE